MTDEEREREFGEAVEANVRRYRLWANSQACGDVEAHPPFECGHPFECFEWDAEDNAKCLWCADVSAARALAVQEAAEGMQGGCLTCVSGDGKPYVKVEFQELEQAQNLHSWLANVRVPPPARPGGGARGHETEF